MKYAAKVRNNSPIGAISAMTSPAQVRFDGPTHSIPNENIEDKHIRTLLHIYVSMDSIG